MPEWLVYLLLLIAVVIGSLIWMMWTARNIKKAVESKIYVTVLKASGARINELYSVDGDTVDIPKPDGSKGSVLLSPESTFDMLYPPGSWPPKFMRASVRSVVVAENSGVPYAPFVVEPLITDTKLNAIKVQAFTRDAIHKGFEEFRGTGAGGSSLKPRYLYIALGVAIVMSGLSAFMAYMAWSQTGSLAAAFGM